MRLAKSALISLMFYSLLSGCVAVPVATDETGPQASPSRADEPADARELKQRADFAGVEFEQQGQLLPASAMQNMVNQLARQFNVDTPLHFHVMRDASINAFAMPNGHIYLNVGLLAKLENQAQVAFVMAHEAAHVIQQHSLHAHLDRKRSSVGSQIASVLSGGLISGEAIIFMRAARYSREQELDADAVGLALYRRAGFSTLNIERVFELFQETNVQESEQDSTYASHPNNAIRRDAIHKLLSDSDSNKARPARMSDQVVVEAAIEAGNLRIVERHYHLALSAIRRAQAIYPDNAELNFLEAECLRLMALYPGNAAQEYVWLNFVFQPFDADTDSEPDQTKLYQHNKAEQQRFEDEVHKQALLFEQKSRQHAALARVIYEEILDSHPDHAKAHRGLAYVAMQAGDKIATRQHFNDYLMSTEHKRDERFIEHLLDSIQQAEEWE